MYQHTPILVNEVLKFIRPHDHQIIVDVTAGGGGHLGSIIQICHNCQIIGIDQDPDAVRELQKKFKNKVTIFRGNFREIILILKKLKIDKVDAIIADLGVSTYQLETQERGFSFNLNAPLDMRMNPSQNLTAKIIVNRFSGNKIREIITKFGEQPYAGAITRQILTARQIKPIESTNELVVIIKKALPPSFRHSRSKIHFATNTFRALRMAVNDELGALESLLNQISKIVKPHGKVAIITFHSLEDRLVKTALSSWQGQRLKIKPTDQEIIKNPKARSARLRGFKFA